MGRVRRRRALLEIIEQVCRCAYFMLVVLCMSYLFLILRINRPLSQHSATKDFSGQATLAVLITIALLSAIMLLIIFESARPQSWMVAKLVRWENWADRLLISNT